MKATVGDVLLFALWLLLFISAVQLGVTETMIYGTPLHPGPVFWAMAGATHFMMAMRQLQRTIKK